MAVPFPFLFLQIKCNSSHFTNSPYLKSFRFPRKVQEKERGTKALKQALALCPPCAGPSKNEKEKQMPDQQQGQQGQKGKNTQGQRPPNVSGNTDKAASGKPGMKDQHQKKKTGAADDDTEGSSSCGSGTCS
jgi:hypothetical protein